MIFNLVFLLLAVGGLSKPAPPMVTFSSSTDPTTSSTTTTTVSPTTLLPLLATSEEESDGSDEAVEGFTTSVKSAVNKIVVTSMEISEEEGEENDPTETNDEIFEVTTTKIDAEKNEEDENMTTLEPEASHKLDSTVIDHIDNNEITIEVDHLDNKSDDKFGLEINVIEPTPKATELKIEKNKRVQTYIPGAEREILIAYLGNIDLSNVDIDTLKATPREKLAIVQELELQNLGLPPFTDPTPWQRLTRDQQLEFNRKYLSLPSDLQSFSRNQFLTLPEKKQMRAYKAFLILDFDSLQKIIKDEMRRVTESSNFVEEKPRNQGERKIFKLNNSNDLIDVSVADKQEIEMVKPKKTNFNKKSKYDPRKRQFKSTLKQRQRKKTGKEHMTRAEKLHFEYARAQLQQAIKLQACLANPSVCNL